MQILSLTKPTGFYEDHPAETIWIDLNDPAPWHFHQSYCQLLNVGSYRVSRLILDLVVGIHITFARTERSRFNPIKARFASVV